MLTFHWVYLVYLHFKTQIEANKMKITSTFATIYGPDNSFNTGGAWDSEYSAFTMSYDMIGLSFLRFT